MVESSDSILPYSYAPLAPSNNSNVVTGAEKLTRRRSLKTGLLVFSALLISALIMSSVDFNTELNVTKNETKKVDDLALRPAPQNLAGIETVPGSNELLFKVTRGKPNGVSEKANGFPMRGLSLPVFDWNDLQLSWQRTAFHFQPQKNWMNDPNGPLYYNGRYHFFYQYNPAGAVWGNIVWGHAVSKDLINWKHLPIAMVADQWYDFNGVWTGSATILPDGQIMMLYTGSTNESVQVQNLAYPADLSDPLLQKWVKYTGNPVLVPPPGIDKLDFRDPTTAWLTSEGKWRLTIGSKVNKTGISLLYDTTDFKHYELLSNILHAVPGTGMWECVDFYPVSKAEPNGVDTSINNPLVKHVFKASMDDDRNDYYALGTYHEDTGTWVPDNAAIDVGYGLRYDYGRFYASKTFYDKEKKRRILWGWITEADSEAADVKKGWASLQALPRTVLYDQKTKANLVQWPVEEVETLRKNVKEFDKVEVPAGSVLHLDVSSATEIDIVAEFDIEKEALEKLPVSEENFSCPASKGASQRGALGPFGLLVLADDQLSEQTPVYFYVIKTSHTSFKNFFCTDLSRSSIAPDVVKDIYGSDVPVLNNEKLSMRALVDHSIIEAFAQGGRTCITSRVYPTKAIYRDAKLYLFNNATAASVTASVKTWQMSTA
ncbi:acid beta-fructofuranosidase 2, vacuolar-like [Amaranthus tricolor]|uniref:acid beta-fructofuranosidase 2, vacuolar-like n=1 Tax=Amaranthus tricolor TaxID=29722 RepID=UPI002590C228|nr:acid beta-fructofuranosidase 2, vacuolar-like [Amaranthus tricolor]